jgi:hypothetical protein
VIVVIYPISGSSRGFFFVTDSDCNVIRHLSYMVLFVLSAHAAYTIGCTIWCCMYCMILVKAHPLLLLLLLFALFFALSHNTLERSTIESPGMPIKSKNVRNLPVHFSLVLGDLNANRNIEYRSIVEESTSTPIPCACTPVVTSH